MRKFFYDEDIDENEDLGSEERLNLDNPEEIEDNDGYDEQEDPDRRLTDSDVIEISSYPNLLAALRNELKLLDIDRGVIAFRHKNINYEGVPMLEINPNKFVFKVTSDAGDKDVMKSFNLSDITVKKVEND